MQEIKISSAEIKDINTVNVNGSSFVIHWEAIMFIDPHFFLFSIANWKVWNIFFAINIGTWRISYTPQNAGFKFDIPFLCELEFSSHWTANRNWISSYLSKIILNYLTNIFNNNESRKQISTFSLIKLNYQDTNKAKKKFPLQTCDLETTLNGISMQK